MEPQMHGSIVLRDDYSAGDLRKLARRENNGRVALRLTAIAAVLEGASRKDAAARSGMDRQTLCDWVHRFNEKGLDGSRYAPCGPSEEAADGLAASGGEGARAQRPAPQARTGLCGGAVRISRAGIEAGKAPGPTTRRPRIGKLLHALNLSDPRRASCRSEERRRGQASPSKILRSQSCGQFPAHAAEERRDSGSRTSPVGERTSTYVRRGSTCPRAVRDQRNDSDLHPRAGSVGTRRRSALVMPFANTGKP